MTKKHWHLLIHKTLVNVKDSESLRDQICIYYKIGSALNTLTESLNTGLIKEGMVKFLASQKTFVITGGTSGIGRELVYALSSPDSNIVFTGRNLQNGREIVEKLGTGKAEFYSLDQSNMKDVIEFTKWLSDKEFNICGLVNNASRNSRYGILNISLTEWNEVLNLIITSTMLISQAVANQMIRTKTHGKIINMGAIQYLAPLNSSLAYAAAKGALVSMGRSMAVDLGKYGIQVISLIPGPIYSKGSEPDAYLDSNAATLLGRFGRMREISDLVSFLLSDRNSFMTGNEIIVDGGRLISRKEDPKEITSGKI